MATLAPWDPAMTWALMSASPEQFPLALAVLHEIALQDRFNAIIMIRRLGPDHSGSIQDRSATP